MSTLSCYDSASLSANRFKTTCLLFGWQISPFITWLQEAEEESGEDDDDDDDEDEWICFIKSSSRETY